MVFKKFLNILLICTTLISLQNIYGSEVGPKESDFLIDLPEQELSSKQKIGALITNVGCLFVPPVDDLSSLAQKGKLGNNPVPEEAQATLASYFKDKDGRTFYVFTNGDHLIISTPRKRFPFGLKQEKHNDLTFKGITHINAEKWNKLSQAARKELLKKENYKLHSLYLPYMKAASATIIGTGVLVAGSLVYKKFKNKFTNSSYSNLGTGLFSLGAFSILASNALAKKAARSVAEKTTQKVVEENIKSQIDQFDL